MTDTAANLLQLIENTFGKDSATYQSVQKHLSEGADVNQIIHELMILATPITVPN